LLVIVVSTLFLYVFPWADQFFPFLRVTVDDPGSARAIARSVVAPGAGTA
jgi:hypothetical protein